MRSVTGTKPLQVHGELAQIWAVNTLRILHSLFVGASLLWTSNAWADSTVCSHPQRAGVRARMSVDLPSGGAPQLEEQITAIAESRLGMSVGGVGFEDPQARPPLRESHLILQSPDVSVAITISTTNRNNRAQIRLKRTCYYDKQVPWKPYWRALTTFLRNAGYRIEG